MARTNGLPGRYALRYQKGTFEMGWSGPTLFRSLAKAEARKAKTGVGAEIVLVIGKDADGKPAILKQDAITDDLMKQAFKIAKSPPSREIAASVEKLRALFEAEIGRLAVRKTKSYRRWLDSRYRCQLRRKYYIRGLLIRP